MLHEIPIVLVWECDPDIAPYVFALNGPAGFDLHIAGRTIALSIEDEIYAAVVDRQKSIESLFKGEAYDRVTINDLSDLGTVAIHGCGPDFWLVVVRAPCLSDCVGSQTDRR